MESESLIFTGLEIPRDYSKEKGVIQNSAYQAFLSAIQSDNQKLSQQYSGDWKDLRLNLNVSDGDRKMLNGIWDYYANKR